MQLWPLGINKEAEQCHHGSSQGCLTDVICHFKNKRPNIVYGFEWYFATFMFLQFFPSLVIIWRDIARDYQCINTAIVYVQLENVSTTSLITI